MTKWILLITTTLLTLSSPSFADQDQGFEINSEGEQSVEYWGY